MLERRIVSGEGLLFPDREAVGVRTHAPLLLDDSWPTAFRDRVGETVAVRVSPLTGCYEFRDESGSVFWIDEPVAPLVWNWVAPFRLPFSLSPETDELLAPWRLEDHWPLSTAAIESPRILPCPPRSSIRMNPPQLEPITNLCLTAFAITETNLFFTASWPMDNLLPDAMFDLYCTTNLPWSHGCLLCTETDATNPPVSFSIPSTLVPGWRSATSHVHDTNCPVATNIVVSPLDGTTVYTNISYGCSSVLSSGESAFFRIGTRDDTDGDGLPDAFELLVTGTNPYLCDTDRDGLADPDELDIGTNPLLADTDDDGIPDGWEAARSELFDPLDPADGLSDADDDGLALGRELFVLHTDPNSWDSDADGLSDQEEILLDTDPTFWDTDGDGLCDGDEMTRGTNPLLWDTDCDGVSDGWEHDHAPFAPLDPSDGDADTDGDGLSNGFEISFLNTDWRRSDTDEDGLSDRVEMIRGTDPLDPDTDGDGLSDGAEDMFGTNDLLWDTDGDGCPDGWETRHGFNPLSALSPDLSEDPDGDGLCNSEECLLDTNPFVADTDGDGIPDRTETGWISVGTSTPWELPDADELLPLFSDLDNGFCVVPLPFPISVRGGFACTNLAVSIDGSLAFSEDIPAWMTCCAHTGTPLLLNAFADDLIARSESSLLMAEVQTNGVRHLIMEYRNFGFASLPADATNAVSFQIDIPGTEPSEVRVRFFRATSLRSNPPLSDRALGSRAELSVETDRNELRHSFHEPVAVPGLEITYHLGAATNPARADTDSDGIQDAAELGLGTDPTRRDTDSDGLDDGEESAAGLSPTTPGDGGSDPDGDGLPNETEILLGTDCSDPDTDGDGISDGDEWTQGSDPLDAADFGPHAVVPVTVTFGDPSISRSEIYETTVTPLSGDTRGPMRAVNREFGQLDGLELQLLENAVYEISLRPVASSRQIPDPDYRLAFEVSDPASGTSVLCLDPDELLGDHDDVPSSQFDKRARLALVCARLLADINRDGVIDESDVGLGPLRMWVNDDCDEDAVTSASADIPDGNGMSPCHNGSNRTIDGMSDLEDFFPVCIDVEAALSVLRIALPDARLKIRLRQADQAVAMTATTLSVSSANAYLIDPEVAALLRNSAVLVIGNDGITVPDTLLTAWPEHPVPFVFLVEGRKCSNRPLVLEICADGRIVVAQTLPLSVSPVESFYRWVNLRDAAGGDIDRPTDVTPPSSWPDAESDDTVVVFVHGFNVSEQAAKGWNAEMFKRLWQCGSHARFYAVTWFGDAGPEPGLFYHDNVENAFRTAPAFAQAFSAVDDRTTVFAHSLGNMIVCSAIQDHGYRPARFAMFNAAVPAEALDVSCRNQNGLFNPMVHEEWAAYSANVWASSWHSLFINDPTRKALTWCGRFRDVPSRTELFNYYSAGDEVLSIFSVPDADGSGTITVNGGTGGGFGIHAWQKQERFKGRFGIDLWCGNAGTSEMGWGFSPSGIWNDGSPPMYHNLFVDGFIVAQHFREGAYSVSEATSATASQLREDPVFRHVPVSILGTAPLSQSEISRLLARGIPALSGPAGSRSLPILNATHTRNLNDCASVASWPRRNDVEWSGWRHGDLRAIALPFVSEFFFQMLPQEDERP